MTVPDDAHISLVGIAFRKNVEVAEDEAMPDLRRYGRWSSSRPDDVSVSWTRTWSTQYQ